MGYIENPKTKGSGIVACIPQKGKCPNMCADCFFQSGRSFLEPLEENLPNMPDLRDVVLYNRVVRVNDGNDSNHQRELVIKNTQQYPMKFYNTAIPFNIGNFDAPVVLTVNPSNMTDVGFHKLDRIQKNLMFVRIRTNMWNMNDVVRPAVDWYTKKGVPVVLTFMAYYDTEVPEAWKKYYIFKKRTLNSYWVILTDYWKFIMDLFWENDLVYSCSKIEGELASRSCARCGNCLREYFGTMERMRT